MSVYRYRHPQSAVKPAEGFAEIAQLVELEVGGSSPPLGTHHIKSKKTMTEINVFDAKGKIVFRSVEPILMTEEQVQKELKAWCVNTTNRRVIITYNHK